MPMPDGTTWDYTPGSIATLGNLGYTYDDLSPAVAPVPLSDRLERLGIAAAVAREAETMTTEKTVELVGASREAMVVKGAEAHTSVQLNAGMRGKIAASLTVTAG